MNTVLFLSEHVSNSLSFIDGYRDRGRRSPPYYDESEPEDQCRIFVALFDYDPLSMSPNPDAAEEELPFKEGQIIRVGEASGPGRLFLFNLLSFSNVLINVVTAPINVNDRHYRRSYVCRRAFGLRLLI